MKAYLLVLAFILAAPAPAQTQVSDGISIWRLHDMRLAATRRGDFVEMHRLTRRIAAVSRSPLDMAELGRQLWYGTGTERDPAEAVRWFQRAAELGDSGAQLHLAEAYFHGIGIGRDGAESLRWLRLAAPHNTLAGLDLSVHLRLGTDGPADPASADILLFRVVESLSESWTDPRTRFKPDGDVAQFIYRFVGGALLCPRAAPPQPKLARPWFARLAQDGDAKAAYKLGLIDGGAGAAALCGARFG